MTAVPGVVLAGGASRRMGRDKAMVPFAGRPLVAWTSARLSASCAPVAVSRHDGRLEGVDLGLPLLADGFAGQAGPLAGLLAALDWAAAACPGARHVATAPVDAPFLPEDFLFRLAAAREASGSAAAVAASGGRRHPVAALWPVAAREPLRAALRSEGLRRVGLFLDRLRPAVAAWAAGPYDPFLNVNTPEDLVAAEALRARLAGETGGAEPCRSPT